MRDHLWSSAPFLRHVALEDTGTAAERSGLEKAMQAEYGDQYINLREYMSTSGLQDAGIEATDEDKEMMAEGMTPSSLLSDTVHFTEDGYKLIGNLIYERMDELGDFDEIKADLEEAGVK
jgi:lysophospholipase L1-like esterase